MVSHTLLLISAVLVRDANSDDVVASCLYDKDFKEHCNTGLDGPSFLLKIFLATQFVEIDKLPLYVSKVRLYTPNGGQPQVN